MRAPFLDPRTAIIPLAYGLQSRMDARAIAAPGMTRCQNAEFDQEGGVQTRRPYAQLSTTILGGGNVADLRKLAVDGDELLLFTKTSLYSRSVRDAAWVLRSEYLAPYITERTVFTRADDQVFAERAELLGVAVYVWQEVGATTQCYIAAEDVETGAQLLAPTVLGAAGTTPVRPRILAQTTRFLVTYQSTAGTVQHAYQVDPANLATSLAAGKAAPAVIALLVSGPGDAVVATTGVAYVLVQQIAGAGFSLSRITDAFAITTVSVGRLCQGGLAVAVSPGVAQVFVIRHNTTAGQIRVDRLNPTTLADVALDINAGAPLNTTVNQLTAAFRTVADGGQFRCYIFWSCGETTGGGTSGASTFVCESNFVDTAGTAGTKVIISRRMGVASRAFDYIGRVHVWLTFGNESEASGMSLPLTLRAALQNGYYLVSDQSTDHAATPIAKAVSDRAGGFNGIQGHAGTVQALSATSYSWTGIARRIIQLGENQTGYSGRGPRVVQLAFDSDEARRTAKLGRTLYVSGGQILQHDGVNLVEVGFHMSPWAFSTVTIAGNLPAGTYNHKWSLSWPNARQEKERSTTVAASSSLIAVNQRFQFAGPPPLTMTRRKGAVPAPATEAWRTVINPVTGSAFFLVTSVVPSSLANPNRYLPNDPTAILEPTFEDNMLDATLQKQEAYPENIIPGASAGPLPRLPPAPAGLVIATQDRIVLGRVAEDPNRIDYSLLRGVDEIAAFNGNLQFYLPPDGGPITALLFYAENLAVFKETALYALPGDGFDNLGDGQNYGPARLISADLGAVSQETVALTPVGPIFKSGKGWYLLHGWSPIYIGGPVAEFDGDTVTGVTVVESQHQVRIVSRERILVWDYEANRQNARSAHEAQAGAWSEWTIEHGLSSVMWRGEHVVIADNVEGGDAAVLTQTDFGDPAVLETYALDIELGWIMTADLLGHQRIWWLMPYGEYRSAHDLRIRLKRNGDETVFDDRVWTVSPTVVGGPLLVRHGPKIQENHSLKVRITAQAVGAGTPPTGEALKLTALGVEYGVEQGLFRGLPVAQRQ